MDAGAQEGFWPNGIMAGRYRLERVVASGGMGEVWAGEHLTLGTRIAVKRLLPHAATDEFHARFKREALLLARVRSEHVVRVLDFVVDDALGPMLVMEYVEGKPLSDTITARQWSVDEAIDLGIAIVRALRDLHAARVVHRDIKPGNILVSKDGDGTKVVLVDLGIGRSVEENPEDTTLGDSEITRGDLVLGTIAYMAPEQIGSSHDATYSADLYAVGAILYRALTGHHVFGSLNAFDLLRAKRSLDAPALAIDMRDAVAKGLGRIVARALERSPAARYTTAEEMLDELLDLRDASASPRSALDVLTELMELGPANDTIPVLSVVRAAAGAREKTPRRFAWVSLAILSLALLVSDRNLEAGETSPRLQTAAASTVSGLGEPAGEWLLSSETSARPSATMHLADATYAGSDACSEPDAAGAEAPCAAPDEPGPRRATRPATRTSKTAGGLVRTSFAPRVGRVEF